LDLETCSDSEDDETQLKKFSISKSDLVQFKKLTKDGCSHWYHTMTDKIYTNNIKGLWVSCNNKLLIKTYFDEIEEIKSNISKSLKDKKNKKK
jgi:hypothetical protein